MSGVFELARRHGTQVSHNHEPIALTLTVANLTTSDGHTLSAGLTVRAKLIDRLADVTLFDEQILAGREVVTVDDLRQSLIVPVTASLQTFAAQHDVAACLRQQETIEVLLLQRLNAFGFGCGMEFFAPIQLQLMSESWQLQRLQSQRSQAQIDAIQRAEQLNERFTALGPNRLAIEEQAALLPGMFKQAATGHDRFFLVAGENLISIDAATLALTPTPVPAEIGLTRSVRCLSVDGTERIAVGGQRGLWLLPAESQPACSFLFESASQRGINAAAWREASREMVATHGELGLMMWPIDRPAMSRIVPTPADPRWLIRLDERLAFCCGPDVCVFEGANVKVVFVGKSKVIAMFSLLHELWIVREDGVLDRLDVTTLKPIATHRLPARVQSAAGISLAGLNLMVLAGAAGEVDCVNAAGEYLLRFPRSLSALRMIAHSGGHVAGVSADRASIVIWNGGEPMQEPRSINILARTGHRIADLVTCGTGV